MFLGSASGITGTAASPAWSAVGQQDGNEFGYSVSTAGDVNGDGYSDVIIGECYNSGAGTYSGKAYAYYGSSSGITGSASSAANVKGEAAGDWFGNSVSTAGDVNGDGYSDVVVGAPGNNSGTGKVYVFHGAASGIASSPAWTAVGQAAMTGFGWTVATTGDVNGDGYSDIVVDAHASNSNAGKVFVFHGSATGITGTSASPAWSATGEVSGDYFGWSVATAGDVNGDGYSDVVIGTRYGNKAYVFHGSVTGLTGTPASPAWSAVSTGENFGWSAAGAGDVNGDGYSDIIVGAYANNSATGKVYTFHGSVSGISGTAASPAWSATGEAINNYFGMSVSTAGDVNGDGYSDVIVGAGEGGKAYVFHGSSSGITGTSASPAWSCSGVGGNDQFGSSVSAAGDVNGDGYSDVIVGAPWNDEGGTNFGKVYVFQGSVSGITGTAATPAWSALGQSAGEEFGHCVSTAGDVNGDGYSDVISGALSDEAGADSGKAYVFLGGGGGGKSFNPRQLKADGSTMQKLGMSNSSSSFKISAKAKSYAGRSKAKLQWEVKPFGTSFNGSGLGKSASWTDTTVNGVTITETVTGLTASTMYHWRARFIYANPIILYSPWFSTGNNGWNEADFRTNNQYTVTFVEGANGSITGTKVQAVVQGANCSQVTAVPDSGYRFVNWTGDYTGTANPLTVTNVTADMNITANFEWAASPEGDFTFNSGTHTITGYTGAGGAVVIPLTIGGVSVNAIGNDAFLSCSSITSIGIPSSVTIIGNYSFSHCTGLTNIDIPDSVTSIGTGAFNGSGLVTANIGSGVSSIGLWAFFCNLTTITVSADNPNYSTEDGVLFNKTKTTLVKYPAGKTGVYTVPSTVTTIANQAFSGVAGGTNVIIPDSVTSIAGSSLSDVGDISVSAGNPNYSSQDGVLFNKAKTVLLQYPTRNGSYVIPPTVTTIGTAAFTGCTGLSGITIPSSVTTIQAEAFITCTGLSSLILPGNLSSIGADAFYGCSGLTMIVIPDTVTSIGLRAFACPNLHKVFFRGNAPSTFGSNVFPASSFAIYYRTSKTGFSTPAWNGYPCYPYTGLRVKADATGLDNGSTWTDAFTDLQTALLVAGAGDEIWVAAGTYKPTSGTDRAISFQLKSNVSVYGGFAGNESARGERDWKTNETILSGDIGAAGNDSDNSYHVVKAYSVNNGLLDGFTVTKGKADGSSPQDWGGGVLIEEWSTATISNCSFKANSSSKNGGAIECQGYGNLTLKDSLLEDNNSVCGGAICFDNPSNGTVTNCIFENNSSASNGGAVFISHNLPISITNCTFSNNSSPSGGALYDSSSALVQVKNCIMWGNAGGQISGTPPIVSYSDIQGGYSGTGNIDTDPLFVNAASKDFHLKSVAGHWTSGGWVTDAQTSPCVDAGDPASSFVNEPAPNGGRINMGAYGNTAQASKSKYVVVFTSGASGSISGTALQLVNSGADCSPVTAVSSHNYRFIGWTGSYVGTVNPLTITNVTSDMTITANFVNWDSNNDSLPDEWELAHGLDLGEKNAFSDSNNDGILNFDEWVRNTDPKAEHRASINFKLADSYSSGTGPFMILVADFNRDGITDIAVACETSGTVDIRLGVADGSFGTVQTLTPPAVPNWLAAGDFDQDGKIDLAMTQGGKGTVYLGNGDGTFSLSDQKTSAMSANHLAVADFNADGFHDILAISSGNWDYQLNKGDGDGTLQNAVGGNSGHYNRQLNVADFDEDGLLDFVTFAHDDLSLNFHKGLGDGTFAAKTTITGPNSPSGSIAVDLNKDGHMDLVVVRKNAAAGLAYTGNGDGSFNTGASFVLSDFANGIACGDFNADGNIDIVCPLANDKINVVTRQSLF